MNKNDIIDYVMHTPHNTNKAVLNSMLNQLADGGGEESWTTLTEETVTTEATLVGALVTLSYAQPLDADSIKVTVNGAEYVLEKKDLGLNGVGYGAFDGDGVSDFSVYPIGINSNNGTNYVHTETAGTYTIKIEVPQSGGSSDFSTATVTIVNTNSDPRDNVLGFMPICYEAGELGPEAPAVIEATFDIESEATEVFVVPIYKSGVTTAMFDSAMTIVSVTGNAMWNEEETDVYIAGDCTITAHRSH